jgi:hypothetical protein
MSALSSMFSSQPTIFLLLETKLIRDDRRLYYNAERVRTCNSVLTKNPGMFASVNNSTDPTTGQIIGYISNAGIPSISNQTIQELDVITPYGAFPLILVDTAVGLAWWKNMVDGKRMQSKRIVALLTHANFNYEYI